MGGIIDGRLEDVLDLSLVDLDESNIGTECDDCPSLDYSYDDMDVNDNPPNPILKLHDRSLSMVSYGYPR
jgi:hypothetical protein